uniref:Uncharacterized protein n=1 Tax=Oryza barthii TaxID=65489 RepID=A0A0D3H686_9ORYZ
MASAPTGSGAVASRSGAVVAGSGPPSTGGGVLVARRRGLAVVLGGGDLARLGGGNQAGDAAGAASGTEHGDDRCGGGGAARAGGDAGDAGGGNDAFSQIWLAVVAAADGGSDGRRLWRHRLRRLAGEAAAVVVEASWRQSRGLVGGEACCAGVVEAGDVWLSWRPALCGSGRASWRSAVVWSRSRRHGARGQRQRVLVAAGYDSGRLAAMAVATVDRRSVTLSGGRFGASLLLGCVLALSICGWWYNFFNFPGYDPPGL